MVIAHNDITPPNWRERLKGKPFAPRGLSSRLHKMLDTKKRGISRKLVTLALDMPPRDDYFGYVVWGENSTYLRVTFDRDPSLERTHPLLRTAKRSACDICNKRKGRKNNQGKIAKADRDPRTQGVLSNEMINVMPVPEPDRCSVPSLTICHCKNKTNDKKLKEPFQRPRVQNWKRNKISTRSSRSKQRLFDRLAIIDRKKAPAKEWYRLTLTLGINIKNIKSILSHFFDAVDKEVGAKLVAIWSMEFQKRGVAHFEVLMRIPTSLTDGKNFTNSLEEISARHWHQKTKSPSLAITREHISVRRIESDADFEIQIAHYLGKQTQLPPDAILPGSAWDNDFVKNPGRFWGIHNKKSYQKIITVRVQQVSRQQAVQIRRILWNYLKSKYRKFKRPRLLADCTFRIPVRILLQALRISPLKIPDAARVTA